MTYRFWSKVKKSSGCWEWQASKNNTGYGTVRFLGKTYTAHRVAAYLVGMVAAPSAPKLKSDKGHVLHKCDNRGCCNPKHFFLGNYRDNQKDAYNKKRRAQPKGEHHTNAKLTNRQAAAVILKYHRGRVQTALAKEYGVSQSCISHIIRGETYR